MKVGFSPGLAFYHDRTGVTGYGENIAMHIGQHRFCNKPPGPEPEECSAYRFSTVWERNGRQWSLLRVLS